MWDADSLLSDPAVSDYLGEEPTISATDHEDFGKKVSEMVVQSSITLIHSFSVGAMPFVVRRTVHLGPGTEVSPPTLLMSPKILMLLLV